jgi:hypothetical protein
MKDFVVFGLSGMLSASKRSEYRQKCREQAQHVLRFIVDNNLNRSDRPLPSSVTDDLVIMASDLTEDGMATIREGLRKWMAMHDRGGSASDMRILDEALMKVRAKS